MSDDIIFFSVMIAIFVGWAMPSLLRLLISPAPREQRLVAVIWVAIAGIIYFIISDEQMMTEVLTGVALASLAARFLWELGVMHGECSRAIEAILLLPTLEERMAYVASLPDDIQVMVQKRTPTTVVLLENCTNPIGRTV
ncbi:MAG: hypothetical protein AAB737_04690 [Patescibacteria group bacterium]